MSTSTIAVLPSPGVLVAPARLTDGLGNEVELLHQILAAIDQFRAGKLSWRELQSLRQQAQELLPRVPGETAADGLIRAVARIDAQGRTAGDDTGWDVVNVLKSHRDQAWSMAQRNQGDITHGKLRRARDWARQVMAARQGHWEQGAQVNAGQLLGDIETKYLPALENLEVRQISALEQARRSFVRAPTPEGRQLLQQWRDLMNARFNANEFAPRNGRVLKQVLDAANAALQSPAGRQHAPRDAMVSGGDPPPRVKPRVIDIDPDGDGPLKATYVGVDKGQTRLQTRVVAVQQHDGSRWVTTGYEARGVTVTDLRTNRIVSERPGRKYTLEDVRSPEQAVNRAREMLQHDGITTRSDNSRKSPSVLDGTNDGRFETPSLIVPKGLGGLGNRWRAGFQEVLEAQVGADAQRYLKAGNALIGLRGTDLPNYVGVAMDLAPNVVPVQGAGNQLLYKGEALQAIDTVTQAIRAAGGEAPQVRAVPVYLRVADDKMAKTTIFRVQGRDGRERIVDNVGRTYESLEKWKQSNQLGAVDVFLPQGGRLQGRDGQVVLEAFNNRRFDNTVLPVLRGGVAILGAGAGVAAMLGSNGVAAPLVMAGGAVFSVADSGATLADRARHGQTLGLNDPQARAAWLDFGAGLLGAGAIGSGSKVLARASDLADVLTLGNSARDLASDWDKLGAGERVLAGAQLAFWGAMLGASQFSGGRFNLDPLWARARGGDGGARDGSNASASAHSNRGAVEPNRRPGDQPYPPGQGSEPSPIRPPGPRTEPTLAQQEQQVQQQVQDLTQHWAQELFSTAEFRQRFERASVGVSGDLDVRAKLLADPVRVQALGQSVALDAVMERTFGGSGVPDAVRQAFQGRAEAWARQQASAQGGTAAGWLEALAMHKNASGYRAELLRPVVAEHLGGGNERLKHALEVQLRPLDESALKNLVAPGRGGGPQQAAVDTLRRALVARWAEDYGKIGDQDWLSMHDDEIGGRLKGKTPEQQRAELVKLADEGTEGLFPPVQKEPKAPGASNGDSSTIPNPTEADFAKVFPYNDESLKVFVNIEGVYHRIKGYDPNTGLVKTEQTDIAMILGNHLNGKVGDIDVFPGVFPGVDSRLIKERDVIKDHRGLKWQVVSKTNFNPFNLTSSNITLSRQTEIMYPVRNLLENIGKLENPKLEKIIIGAESKIIAEKPKTNFFERLGYLPDFLTGDKTRVIERIGYENIVSTKQVNSAPAKYIYPYSENNSFLIDQVDFTNLKNGDKFIMNDQKYTLEEKSIKGKYVNYMMLIDSSGNVIYREKPPVVADSHIFSLGVKFPSKSKTHSVEVYIPSLTNGEPDLKMLEKIKKAIAQMPTEHFEALERIRINPNIKEGSPNSAASASKDPYVDTPTIDFYAPSKEHKDYLTKFLADVANHELGHLISHKLFDSFRPNNIWDEAVRADAKHVSNYAKTNMSEDFAESVMYYLMTDGGRTNPATREQFSNRFKVLDELFKANIDQKYILEQEAKRALIESGLIVAATVVGVGGAYFLLDDEDEKNK